MNRKVIPAKSLEDILLRFNCCGALLDTIRWSLSEGGMLDDALAGATDLLNSICRDFEACLDAAAECGEGREAV